MANVQDVKDFWTRNLNGMKFLDQRPTTAMEFRDASDLRYAYHYHLPILFDQVAREIPGGKLLEIGCGMGDDTAQWAMRGMDVTAVDLTEPAVACTTQRLERLGLSGSVQTGNAEALSFEDDSFDVVYSFGVLHHSPDTPAAINEVHRVLRPGGRALIMLYNRHSLNYVVHRVLRYPFDGTSKDPCPVEHTYSPQAIREMFHRFRQVNVKRDYLFGTGYGAINSLIPSSLHRAMGKLVGWHLMIDAKA